MSETMFFNGRILPGYVGFSYSKPIELESVSGTKQRVRAKVSVLKGKVSVMVQALGKEGIELEALRYYAETVTRSIADSYGFVVGAAFDVEIAACVNLEGEQAVFGNGLEEFKQDGVDPEMVLGAALRSPHLQRALADYRLAIQTPHDTSFYAYRAIESLREHFRGFPKGVSKKEGWERLRSGLDLSKEDLTKWKALADKQRHAELVESIDQDERVKNLRDVAEVVLRFAQHILEGGSKT